MNPLKHKVAHALTIALCGFLVSHAPVFGQSVTEADALASIKRATNPTTKLAAAEDFLAKFPKSNARLDIAELIADEIVKVNNGAVALTLLARAQAVSLLNRNERSSNRQHWKRT